MYVYNIYIYIYISIGIILYSHPFLYTTYTTTFIYYPWLPLVPGPPCVRSAYSWSDRSENERCEEWDNGTGS